MKTYTEERDLSEHPSFRKLNPYDGKSQPKRKRYAFKQLKRSLTPEEMSVGVADIWNEVSCLKKMAHPNVIRMRGVVYDVGGDNSVCIILDKLNRTLEQEIIRWEQEIGSMDRSILKRSKTKNEMKMIWKEKINAAYGIACAINYLHAQRIVYRDIKPQNIGFDAQGNVKLFDFGTAKELHSKIPGKDAYNMTGLTGSVRYMAPEVFNEKPYNLSVDIYSFGILFWTICSMKIPYFRYDMEAIQNDVVNGTSRPSLQRSWKKGWSKLMKNCWDGEPARRPTILNVLDFLSNESKM
mmetsp:Transcript_21202/g.48138  ORF Transcript_21202/g.48138 Transcript_21202/m.48138 type:complete len:295 (+) Transcript_21202:217-1101(+)